MRQLTGRLIPLLVAALVPAASAGGPGALIVHEWGTFTSIAGADGSAVEWTPLAGPSDLPCFVERSQFNIKGSLSGTVRMETPVLYFYAPAETRVSVGVRFRQGVITEWFPRAVVTPANGASAFGSSGTIAWRGVTVAPGAAEAFPVEAAASHYYAARRTAAAPLDAHGQREKFLFYRGVGRFLPPLAAVARGDGGVAVSTPPGAAIGDVILFRNTGMSTSYEVLHAARAYANTDPEISGVEPAPELNEMLLANGLFPDEATAMLETWRDSWFEEGTRIFYVVPRPDIDAILPLEIAPAPGAIVRAFVGRMEVITPDTLDRVARALAAGDTGRLRPYARFLRPIVDRLKAGATKADAAAIGRRFESASRALNVVSDRCGF